MAKGFDRLSLLATFARIAERGSISAAARDLDMSQASASRQLRELEDRIGVELIRRTTHALALTPAGEACLADARRLLDGWDAMLDSQAEESGALRGRLHVVAPVALGQHDLGDAMLTFREQQPSVDLVWQLQDEPVRFVESGCDLWVRIGPVPDDRLIVRPLGTVERLVVAAPGLVSGKASLAAMARLPCIAIGPFEGQSVPLTGRRGQTVQLAGVPAVTTNNIVSARQAAIRGAGYAVMPRWFVEGDLETGVLCDALPGWRAPSLDVNAAYLPQARLTARLRAFLDHMTEAVSALPGVAVAQAR